jgi:hypothetical protein
MRKNEGCLSPCTVYIHTHISVRTIAPCMPAPQQARRHSPTFVEKSAFAEITHSSRGQCGWIGVGGWMANPRSPLLGPPRQGLHRGLHRSPSNGQSRVCRGVILQSGNPHIRPCRRTSPLPPMGTDDGPSFSRSQDLRVISRRLQTRTHKIEMKTNMQTNVPRSQVHLDLDPNPDHNHIRLHLEERFGRSGR